MKETWRVILGLAIIGASYFLFPLFVPEPKIEQLCTDIWLIGRQCITDPSSAITYPQRLTQWWFMRLAVLGVGFLVGYLQIRRGMGN